MAFGQAATQGFTTPPVTKIIIVEPVAGSGLFFYSPTAGPGNLVGSWTAVAGTDKYGNTYPAGLVVGKVTDSAQVELVPSPGGQAAEVKFPVNAISLSNTPNIAGGVVTGTPNFSDFVISGPALSTAGDKDWVQIALFSNNGAGADANLEFRYINNAGAVTEEGSYDANGFVIRTLEVTNGLQNDTVFSSDAGIIFTDGSGNLTIGNGFTLTPKMATPPNTAAVKAGTATLAQTQVCLGALIQSMQNRGMVS